ncbi:Protein KIN-9 c, partial [Aphelenchoides avenae]
MFDFHVVLGLPFLHRYCLQYDENLAIASIATQTHLRNERCYYEPDPPVDDGDGSSSSTTTTATTVSRTTTTTSFSTSHATKEQTLDGGNTTAGTTTVLSPSSSHSNGLPVLAVVAAGLGALTGVFIVGALLFYCRRRRQRRQRFVKALGSLVPRPNLSGWTSNDDDLPYTEVHADDEFLIRPNNLAINKDQQIGCGAFARVFLGELQRTAHKQHNAGAKGSNSWTKVAVKQARLATEEARHDMHRELELMKDVGRHAHVVGLIGYVPLSSPLLVLEYCKKGDLLTHLRAHLQTHKEAVASAKEELQMWAYANSSVTLKDLISLCWQVSDGMTFLSSRGYVHRDLAARNILLTEEMVAKISDFGLCRFTNENLYVTQRGGKLPIRWMAPETLATANFSTASDV